MKNTFLYMISCSLLGGAFLLGTTGCSDDHFDVVAQNGASGNMTIWQQIESNDSLQLVADLLRSTRVMKNDRDAKATLTYAEWLNRPMEVTAWFPRNEFFKKDYDFYKSLLNSKLEGLSPKDSIAEALKNEYRVADQFIRNHIALFNYGSNHGQQEVRLLNSKQCVFDVSGNKFNGVSYNPSYTSRNSNGVLYVLDHKSEFAYNIYDSMMAYDIFSVVKEIVNDSSVNKIEFSESQSLPGGVNENGEIEYVDSVYITTNTLLNSTGAKIKSEDSVYVAFIPSNEGWQPNFESVKTLYKYGSSYSYDWNPENNSFNYQRSNILVNPDSVANVNAREDLIKSMFFTATNFTNVDVHDSASVVNYALTADSLISTNGVVFYNENANEDHTGINPMFENLEILKASNGYIFVSNDKRIKPEYTFISRREMRPNPYVITLKNSYQDEKRRGDQYTLTAANRNPLVYGSVEDDTYYFFQRRVGTNMDIYFRLNGLASGRYKISLQTLPNRINLNLPVDYDPEAKEDVKFDATLLDDNNEAIGRAKDCVVNPDSVKNVVLFEDISLDKSFRHIPNKYDTFIKLQITVRKQRGERNEYKGRSALSIAKIIVEPVRE